MKTMPFTGTTKSEPAAAVPIPALDRAKQTDPAGYLVEPGLVDAVNVALMVGQPLLLTGEPGTGKTQLAYRIAWELGLGRPLIFETKSTSNARDLFYYFDALRRFHAAHSQGKADNRDYISYNALGRAILMTNDEKNVARFLTPDFGHNGQRRSVVLIDEVDKAPRDFPNDVLNEIENMYFLIPELENARITADASLRPIVIITSNSEKNLPDPFLRRCVYYHIEFPDRTRLMQIVQSRLEQFRGDEKALLRTALDFFQELREGGLRKPPSSAELINWLNVLTRRGVELDCEIAAADGQLQATLPTLIKTREDLEAVRRIAEEYVRKANSTATDFKNVGAK
jgi:MoxR-like ATPase